MKILIAADLHWPTINGVSTFSRNLAQGLAAHGHEVVVIAPSQTGKKYKEIDDNYVIIRTASVPFTFYQNFRISLTPYAEVKKIIDEFQPDVIHIQMLLMIGQAVMRYGNKLGIPIVSTNHAMPENLMDNLKLLAPISKPINYVIKAYGRRFHSKSDYVTMPTQAAIDMFIANTSKMKVTIEPVSNGIDLSRFNDSKPSKMIFEKYGLPTKKPIITYIGRLDAEKHLWVLISSFALVLKKMDCHLLVVGSGTDSENIKSLAAKAGISDHITFTGRVSDEDLVELHKVGAVFCMPSPSELQSIATLESMASGKPIIAVDAGALKELCQDGRNGYLCKHDDYNSIAKGLLAILGDDKLREAMGKESLAISKTHDLQNTLNRFEDIYTELINA